MTQKEINDQEWNNPDNWSGPGWIAFYFSKKDSRTWVPKSIPSFGWTLNLGKSAGAYWLFGILIGILLLITILK